MNLEEVLVQEAVMPQGIIYLTVTQEDIDSGKRFDCQYCPMALAAKRRFGLPDDDPLGYIEVNLYEDEDDEYGFYNTEAFVLYAGREKYVSAERTRQFISDFDNEFPVQPGRYAWRPE